MQKSPQKIKIGTLGEDIACVFLSHKGYQILQRNFKARYGELDIIALDGKALVFIEVKTRQIYYLGHQRKRLLHANFMNLFKQRSIM